MPSLSTRLFKHAATAGAADLCHRRRQGSGRVLGGNDRVRIAVAGIKARASPHDGLCPDEGRQDRLSRRSDSRLFASRSKIVKDRPATRQPASRIRQRALDDKNLDAVSIVHPIIGTRLDGRLGVPGGQGRVYRNPVACNIFEAPKLIGRPESRNTHGQHGARAQRSAVARSWSTTCATEKYGCCVSYGYASRSRPASASSSLRSRPADWISISGSGIHTRPFNTNLVHYNWHWMWDFGAARSETWVRTRSTFAAGPCPPGRARTAWSAWAAASGYKDEAKLQYPFDDDRFRRSHAVAGDSRAD